MDELEQHYKVLNLQPGASLQEIKQAYRHLALRWHPDRYPHDTLSQIKAEQKFKEINQAYNRLRFILTQPQSVRTQSHPSASPPTSPRSQSSQQADVNQRRPAPSPPPASSKAVFWINRLPWGWLLGTFLGYVLLGGILDYLKLPDWAWTLTWIIWFILALMITSGSESQRLWLVILIFAGGAAGWIAGYPLFEPRGLITSFTWAVVGALLGAVAGSDASPWALIWVVTLSGVLAITGFVAGTGLDTWGHAFLGGVLGAIVGILLGVTSDALFKSRSQIGAGQAFGFWFGAWLGAWIGGGSQDIIQNIQDVDPDTIFLGAWGAIAVISGVVTEMVAGEKLTEFFDEPYMFLILIIVTGLGLRLGPWFWMVGDQLL
ncbi:MAG: J domain-containing protein [Microcoleaceae cyanobacterium]